MPHEQAEREPGWAPKVVKKAFIRSVSWSPGSGHAASTLARGHRYGSLAPAKLDAKAWSPHADAHTTSRLRVQGMHGRGVRTASVSPQPKSAAGTPSTPLEKTGVLTARRTPRRPRLRPQEGGPSQHQRPTPSVRFPLPTPSSLRPSQDQQYEFTSSGLGESYELFAAAGGNLEWLRYCLSRQRSTIPADDKGFTAIHFAAQGAEFTCLKALVEEYNFSVDLPTYSGYTPLHLAIQRKKRMALACVDYLIKKGADINYQTSDGFTPLHLAAQEGLLSCVKVLVQNGANVHAQDAIGCKPIDYCKIWNYRNCARFLQDAMWKQDKKEYACEMQKLKMLKEQLVLMEQNYLVEHQKQHQVLRADEFKSWLHQKLLQNKEKEPGTLAQAQPFFRSHKHRKSFYPSPEECLRKQQCKKRILVKPRLIYTSHTTGLFRQKLWNFSNNPARPPVTQIASLPYISLGVDPDPSLEDDLCNFLKVRVSRQEGVELCTVTGNKVEPLPRLPFEVIVQVLCPSLKPYRMKVPEGLCSVSLSNVPHKRHWDGKTWTDALAMNLCETFDETFLAAIRAHQGLPTLPAQISS